MAKTPPPAADPIAPLGGATAADEATTGQSAQADADAARADADAARARGDQPAADVADQQAKEAQARAQGAGDRADLAPPVAERAIQPVSTTRDADGKITIPPSGAARSAAVNPGTGAMQPGTPEPGREPFKKVEQKVVPPGDQGALYPKG